GRGVGGGWPAGGGWYDEHRPARNPGPSGRSARTRRGGAHMVDQPRRAKPSPRCGARASHRTRAVVGGGPQIRHGASPTHALRDGIMTPGWVTADWLALREPADAAARTAELVDLLAERLSTRPSVVVDLGSGSGANMRWLAPRISGAQVWWLIDQDRRLLELAEQT